jgi:hypothetical protein
VAKKKAKATKREMRQIQLLRAVNPDVRLLFEHYRHTLALSSPAKLTVDWGKVVVKLLASLTQIMQAVTGYTGAERQAALAKLAGDFFDQVFAPMIEQQFPLVGKNWITPMARQAFLGIADGMIQGLTDIFNSLGQGGTPTQPVQPTQPQLPSGFVPY